MIQRYVSNELTHFVGRDLTGTVSDHSELQENQYNLLINIIRGAELRSKTRHGGGYSLGKHYVDCEEVFTIPSVCFCDIPLADLQIHRSKYSNFGLAFDKQFLVKQGARPVHYIPIDVPVNLEFGLLTLKEEAALDKWIHARASGKEPDGTMSPTISTIGEMLDRFVKIYHATEQLTPEIRNTPAAQTDGSPILLTKEQSDLLTVAHVIFRHVLCYLKPFCALEPFNSPEHYYMEREWRVPARVRFELEDIKRIILPSRYGRRLREDLPDYYGQINFVEPEN